jgi:proteasome activator subunit 4
VFYFRQVPLISEVKIVEMLEVKRLPFFKLFNEIFKHLYKVLCSCLDDEVVEVREMAAT